MGNGPSKKRQRLQEEIAEQQLKKSNALMRTVVPIIAFVVVAIVKQMLVMQGVPLASDMFVNMAFYLFVLVMAGVAGIGSRDYMRANRKIGELQSRKR